MAFGWSPFESAAEGVKKLGIMNGRQEADSNPNPNPNPDPHPLPSLQLPLPRAVRPRRRALRPGLPTAGAVHAATGATGARRPGRGQCHSAVHADLTEVMHGNTRTWRAREALQLHGNTNPRCATRSWRARAACWTSVTSMVAHTHTQPAGLATRESACWTVLDSGQWTVLDTEDQAGPSPSRFEGRGRPCVANATAAE